MMNTPLVHADWTFTLWAILMFIAALGFWADKTKLGQKISGVAIILALAMALSNFGVLPVQAEVYVIVWSYLVPLAIPLLLFKADLRRVVSETKGMLVAFLIGAVGTAIGAGLGFYLLPLGEDAHKLAGVLSATYIGGSMNLVAVTEAVQLDPSLVTATVAADNVVGVFYLAFLGLVPTIGLFRRRFKTSQPEGEIEPSEQVAEEPVRLDLKHLGFMLGLSFSICAAGKAAADVLDVGGYLDNEARVTI